MRKALTAVIALAALAASASVAPLTSPHKIIRGDVEIVTNTAAYVASATNDVLGAAKRYAGEVVAPVEFSVSRLSSSLPDVAQSATNALAIAANAAPQSNTYTKAETDARIVELSPAVPAKWATANLTNANGVALVELKDVIAETKSSGETWTQSAKTDGNWSVLAYGNGRFVAGSYGLWYSDDGVTWVQSAKPDEYWSALAYGNGRFVAGNHVDAGLWYSDDNGETWTRSTKTDGIWYGLAYGNGRFVAGSYGGGGLWYSDDGVTWVQSAKPDGDWGAIAYGNGRFVAGDYEDDGLWYSDDGVTWTQSAKTDGNWYALAYGNGRFVAGSGDGSTGLWYSDDNGETWTRSTKTDGTWYGLAYGNWRFVAGSGGLWYSEDTYVKSVPVLQGVRVNGVAVAPDTNNVVDVDVPVIDAADPTFSNAVISILRHYGIVE